MEQKQVEVKQVSEREIWIGENRMYLGEDNIIYGTYVGKIDAKIAIGINESGIKLMNLCDTKVTFLHDLNKCGMSSSEARKILKETTEIEKVGKTALWGIHPVARVVASFFMGITKKKDMRFFKTKEEALAWLKE